ncbi:MAG TPA: cytochrome b N-terminal domain-containing protein [Kofleriaceae bacterium]|nr:cytochrome b N-terminal domain-containing protein [Kofleriaceae bacterium]
MSSRREQLEAWLRERVGGERAPSLVPGVSYAYVFGWTLVLLFVVEAVTGAALSAFYSPSATDAWASVAYVQDRMHGGWFVRGLHVHAASALVIVSGVHLLQAAVFGAYKRPRELTWWLGVLLLLLILGFTITGYVLRWDQAGFWANQVEVGIAAGTPLVGGFIRRFLIGGNEYGNLTLTRFYMLHVVLLPAIVLVAMIGHIVLARRHGATPHWERKDSEEGVPRWPHQSFRNVVMMAFVFALLVAYTLHTHGADLAAPADPSAAYDARPLWYFRWLYALRMIAGSAEQIVAMIAPAIVVGLWFALPLLDRKPGRDPRKRLGYIGAVAGLFVVIAVLTAVSFGHDSRDAALLKREHEAQLKGDRARALAMTNGVPVTGAQDVFTTVPMWRARTLWAQHCADCHDADSKDRKGPIITVGHGTRAWIAGFLKDPNGAAFWGKTKLSKTDDAMKAVDITGGDFDDLVEALYAQSGASDVDVAKVERGKKVFDGTCNDCHSLDEGVTGGSGPGLGTLGSRDWYTSFIGNPKSAVHMGDLSEMPRFDRDLSIIDRDALAGYLMWLRTATKNDLAKLGPL